MDEGLRLNWLSRLTDRLVLHPSTHEIDAGSQVRALIPVADGKLEAWTYHVSSEQSADCRKVLLIKFPGNAGRAEYSTPNPAQYWEDVESDVWTINPFGYGGSSGIATLQRYPEMVDAVFHRLRSQFAEHRCIVYGNSLGSISALRMAAKFPVDGVYLRNPVPIHQLISNRLIYAIPSLGLSRFAANQIPSELNAQVNAEKVEAPCLIVSSDRDRLIPPHFQQRIINRISAPKKLFVIREAGHHDPIPDEQGQEYLAAVRWLRDQVFLNELESSRK